MVYTLNDGIYCNALSEFWQLVVPLLVVYPKVQLFFMCAMVTTKKNKKTLNYRFFVFSLICVLT